MLVNRRLDLHSLADSLAHFSKETFFVFRTFHFGEGVEILSYIVPFDETINSISICTYMLLIYLTMHSSDDRRKVHFVVAWMQ